MNTQDKVLTVVGVATVLAIASGAGYTLFATQDADVPKVVVASNSNVASTAASTPQQTSTVATNQTSYRDGTYTATASYRVPEGETNSITVKVTINGGTVAAVSATHDYGSRESARYINWFDQDIQSAVVGQSVGGLQVSRVGGASLTSIAFDDALDTIRSDAKA